MLFSQGVVAYAVGETLVCETLAEAQDLCFTRNEKVWYPL
jgi:chromosome segregation ATPase